MRCCRAVRMVSTVVLAAAAVLPRASARGEVKPFLEMYCVRCHGETSPEGDVSLLKLSEASQKPADLEVWQRVVSQLESGAMPPSPLCQYS